MSDAVLVLFKSAKDLQKAPDLFSEQAASVLTEGASSKRDEVVETAQNVECIKSPAAQQIAANCLVAIQDLLSGIETGRKILKKPFDDIGKRIQSDVATFIKPLEVEKERLKKLLGSYQVEVERQAREEQQRQDAELQRLEEEKAKLDAAPPTAETQQRSAQLEAEMGQNMKVIEPTKATGVSTRPVRKFAVVDLHKLYAVRPDLVKLEPNTALINATIRAEGNENLLLDGLTITTEMEVVPR